MSEMWHSFAANLRPSSHHLSPAFHHEFTIKKPRSATVFSQKPQQKQQPTTPGKNLFPSTGNPRKSHCRTRCRHPTQAWIPPSCHRKNEPASPAEPWSSLSPSLSSLPSRSSSSSAPASSTAEGISQPKDEKADSFESAFSCFYSKSLRGEGLQKQRFTESGCAEQLPG